jgi:hypothetical protein
VSLLSGTLSRNSPKFYSARRLKNIARRLKNLGVMILVNLLQGASPDAPEQADGNSDPLTPDKKIL